MPCRKKLKGLDNSELIFLTPAESRGCKLRNQILNVSGLVRHSGAADLRASYNETEFFLEEIVHTMH